MINSKHARGKFSKAEVDYSRGMGETRCKNCTHYMGNHVCELVAGDIDPEYWCKKFQKRGT
jgi:hypothetical protein